MLPILRISLVRASVGLRLTLQSLSSYRVMPMPRSVSCCQLLETLLILSQSILNARIPNTGPNSRKPSTFIGNEVNTGIECSKP